jgi:hypothetical protein
MELAAMLEGDLFYEQREISKMLLGDGDAGALGVAESGAMNDVPAEVFHASRMQGLKIIEPRVSTHGTPWIYAARDEVTASMFLGQHQDFILGSGYIGTQPYIVERFAGAFSRAKAGASGSIYVLDGSSFQSGRTSWHAEVVSEQSLEPLRETVVPDAAEHLLEFERSGRLSIYRFPSRPDHVPIDDSDLIQIASELYAQHGQKLLDYLEREYRTELAHVIAAVRTLED